MKSEILTNLLTLSHDIGREDRGLALLGEGNTSARVSDDTFFVKASGTSLGTLGERDVVECSLPAIMGLFERDGLTDQEIDAALMAARIDQTAKKPSVETIFHALLLSLPGVNYVGHSHAVSVNQILCSPRARDFATCRMFPDEIVCCGVESVYIPLTDPGYVLARAIRREVDAYIRRLGRAPKVILMENHGIIALGATPGAVLAATLMAEKAAKVFVGAALLGGPQFLSPTVVDRIAGRPDEVYRQKLLNLA